MSSVINDDDPWFLDENATLQEQEKKKRAQKLDRRGSTEIELGLDPDAMFKAQRNEMMEEIAEDPKESQNVDF